MGFKHSWRYKWNFIFLFSSSCLCQETTRTHLVASCCCNLISCSRRSASISSCMSLLWLLITLIVLLWSSFTRSYFLSSSAWWNTSLSSYSRVWNQNSFVQLFETPTYQGAFFMMNINWRNLVLLNELGLKHCVDNGFRLSTIECWWSFYNRRPFEAAENNLDGNNHWESSF